MPVFPSVEWFNAIREIINKDEAYRHFGTCDALVGFEIGDKLYKLAFEGFEITEVSEITRDHERELDFTLTMPFETWKAMILDIKKHGRAELDYTLNTLDLMSTGEFVRSHDQSNLDKFYRFNQTFQDFFDASAKFETRFADAAVAS